MTRALAFIDAALADLPNAAPGSQEARNYAEIRRALLRAKARLTSMKRGST